MLPVYPMDDRRASHQPVERKQLFLLPRVVSAVHCPSVRSIDRPVQNELRVGRDLISDQTRINTKLL